MTNSAWRSRCREVAVHMSFELGFSSLTADELLAQRLTSESFSLLAQEDGLYGDFPSGKERGYITALVKGAYAHGAELDGCIERLAVGWKFQRISRVAAAVMRVSMFELLYMPRIPGADTVKVVVNDALEIVRKYEDEEVVRFVNGILGSFVREELPEGN